jgi:eukaryotic-like serine/threonine-protein kinase
MVRPWRAGRPWGSDIVTWRAPWALRPKASRGAGPKGGIADVASSHVEQHRRAIEAFQRLSEASEAEQRDWLRATATSDAALATEVAAMLIADSRGAMDLPTSPGLPANDEAQAFPLNIGPYRLVRRLGGGMGDVFLAQRDDGLFDHAVAIKLIRGGRSLERLSAHLLEERRILAGLQHPNIAQLFGGGATPEGWPFIVMEYLAGAPITEYADSRSIGLSERLRLFQTVGEAVQFAHQALVVHADIKPSNILVTADGRVKLLDFGIAQWSGRRPSRPDPLEGVPPMTLAYAAPERLAGGAPTVAADVYALGVLLFELLTGVRPERSPAARRGDGAARLPAALPSETRSATQASAGVKPGELRGEIDAIVMKAIAEDPARRYASVLELSLDLDRHARGFPVKALPDTWTYRSRRFAGRHRLGLSLTAAALVTASSVAVAMSLLYAQSERNRALADLRFDETRQMADYIIGDVDLQLADLPGTLPLRRRLVAKSRSYLEALEKDRLASPELRLDIARGYLRLARIYGLDVSGGVGDLPAARDSLNRARRVLRSVATGPQRTVLEAEAALDAGTEIFVAPDATTLDRALGELTSAQSLYTQYLRQSPADIDAQLGLWRAQVMSARGYIYRKELAKALAVVTSNLDKAKLPVRTHEQAKNRDFIINGSYLMLAEGNADTDPAKAYDYYERLNANLDGIRRRGDGNAQEAFLRSTALAGMAETSEVRGDLRRAIPLYLASIAVMRQLLAFGPNNEVSRNLLYVEDRLAGAYSKTGRSADALRISSAVIASVSADVRRQSASPTIRRILALSLQQHGIILNRAGSFAAACAADRQAMSEFTATKPVTAALSIDTAPNGPIPHLRSAIVGDCGH